MSRLGQEQALSGYHEKLELVQSQLAKKNEAYELLSSELNAKVADGEKREATLQEK